MSSTRETSVRSQDQVPASAYREGVASTLYFADNEAFSPSHAYRPDPGEQEQSTPGRARVLVVDDEPILREVVCQVLNKNLHEVLQAPSPLWALEDERLWQHQVDLLICDISMPGILGPEFVGKLRRLGICPPHVLYITGGHQGLLDSSDEVLLKPFSPQELVDAVSRLLGADTDCRPEDGSSET